MALTGVGGSGDRGVNLKADSRFRKAVIISHLAACQLAPLCRLGKRSRPFKPHVLAPNALQ